MRKVKMNKNAKLVRIFAIEGLMSTLKGESGVTPSESDQLNKILFDTLGDYVNELGSVKDHNGVRDEMQELVRKLVNELLEKDDVVND